jgi:hypothetical protein
MLDRIDDARHRGAVVLTNDTGQAGAAWAPYAVSPFASWTAAFTLSLSAPIAGGADGAAFVIHADPRGAATLGAAGGALGAGGAGGASPAFAFALRNFQTAGFTGGDAAGRGGGGGGAAAAAEPGAGVIKGAAGAPTAAGGEAAAAGAFVPKKPSKLFF